MTLDELERYETIKKRMDGRACYCGHCDDLRFLLNYVGQSKELIWARTEAEYRAKHPKEAAEIREVEVSA